MAPTESKPTPGTPTKPGVRSTEFWLAVVALVGVVVLAALGRLEGDVIAIATGLISAGYSTGRGLAK